MKKKVLLYLASNSPFYTNLYPSIKNGFEEAGCEVIGGENLLNSASLIGEINKHKPDFVFEMNRVKSEIQNFPDGVIHICWLVDFWGRMHDELRGSDILYTWANDWVKYFEEAGVKPVYYLPPATDSTIYKQQNVEKEYDFIFLGHISKKWSAEELNREIGYKNNKKFYFKDLLPYIRNFVLSKNNTGPFLDSLKAYDILLNSPIDKTLLYDISNRTFRQTRREQYTDMFIELSDKIAIYGSEQWLLYDKYKRLYKGFITKPEEMNAVIQKANILLHDGNYPHFRTFDAMASGVVVAAAQAPDNFEKPWEVLGFKDGEDYLNVDIYSDIIDVERFKDKTLLKQISGRARDKVLNEHLWVHRAEKVIKDISNL